MPQFYPFVTLATCLCLFEEIGNIGAVAIPLLTEGFQEPAVELTLSFKIGDALLSGPLSRLGHRR